MSVDSPKLFSSGHSSFLPFTPNIPADYDTPVHKTLTVVSPKNLLFSDSQEPLMEIDDKFERASSENTQSRAKRNLFQSAPQIGLNDEDMIKYQQQVQNEATEESSEVKNQEKTNSQKSATEESSTAESSLPFTQESVTKILLSKQRVQRDLLDLIEDKEAKRNISFGDDDFVAFAPRVTEDTEKKLSNLLLEMCGADTKRNSKHAERAEYEEVISAYSKFLEASYHVRKVFNELSKSSNKRRRVESNAEDK